MTRMLRTRHFETDARDLFQSVGTRLPASYFIIAKNEVDCAGAMLAVPGALQFGPVSDLGLGCELALICMLLVPRTIPSGHNAKWLPAETRKLVSVTRQS